MRLRHVRNRSLQRQQRGKRLSSLAACANKQRVYVAFTKYSAVTYPVILSCGVVGSCFEYGGCFGIGCASTLPQQRDMAVGFDIRVPGLLATQLHRPRDAHRLLRRWDGL